MNLSIDIPDVWVEQAVCASVDPELFFPEKGGSSRIPKSICARCDVRPECLAYALEGGEEYGIFGGLSEKERRVLRREAA